MRAVVTVALAGTVLAVLPLSAQVWPVGHRLVEHELPQAGSDFGRAVAAGDVDGDGDGDLVVGAPYYDNTSAGQTDNGLARIYFGDPDGTLTYEIGYRSLQTDGWTGWAVAVGNFDCSNSRHEVAVGSVGVDVGGDAHAGVVWVLAWNGTSVGLQGTFDQDDLAGSAAEPSDYFGYTLAAGDFDGDGCDDLAVGSPFEDDVALGDAGMVHVLYGAAGGLTAAGNDFFFGDSIAGGTSNAGDAFGFALAAGDFDGDGYDDLAMSAPWRAVGGDSAAGQVQVAYGSLTGLTTAGAQLFDDDDLGAAAANEQFGHALAAADFDYPGIVACIFGADCADDLAIGVPGQDVFFDSSNRVAAGWVRVLYGTEASGLTTAGVDTISQDGISFANGPESGDRFGSSLAAGAIEPALLFGPDDLLVGVPSEDFSANADGVAHLVLDVAGSPDFDSSQLLWPRSEYLSAPPQNLDNLGFALAVGDFDGDGWGDVALGIPGNEGAGGVEVRFGAVFADGFEFGWTCDWDAPPCF